MLMCLPLTAIVVDFGKSKLSQKSQFKIMRSPYGVEGIRNKRKLLEQSQESSSLGVLRWQILSIDRARYIAKYFLPKPV